MGRVSPYRIDYEAVSPALRARRRVRRLEDLVPGACHRHFALGRAALLWLCRSMGWGAGDRVLLPSFACYSVVTPFTAAGLIPVFYKVHDDLSVDVDELADRARSGVRCGLVIHYFGWLQAPDVRAWLAAEHGPVVLIEDLSHALFTALTGDGPVAAAHVALTSYRKLMPCPDGSTLTFRDGLPASISEAAVGSRYRGHGIVRSLAMRTAAAAEGSASAALVSPVLAATERMLKRWRTGTPLGVGPISTLAREVVERFDIDAAVVARRRNAKHLTARLREMPGCVPLMPTLDDRTVPMVLPVRVAARPTIERVLRRHGVLAQHLWPLPPAVQPAAFPLAARLADELLCLPVDERYSVDDMDVIANTMGKVTEPGGVIRTPADHVGRVATN